MQDLKVQNPKLTFEESLQGRVNAFGEPDRMAWIYQHDIQVAWDDFFARENV